MTGIGVRTAAHARALERTRLWPGASAEALQAWELFVHEPMYRLWDPHCGCGVPQCCPDPRARLPKISKNSGPDFSHYGHTGANGDITEPSHD